METATATATKQTITSVFNKVSEFSHIKEKDSIKESEASINKFLDAVSQYNQYIENRTAKIVSLNIDLQKITNIYRTDESDVKLIREMLDISVRVHGKLVRYYVKNSWTIKKGLSAKAMLDFKHALDDWKEYNEDIEDKFFLLSQDKELEALSQELKDLVSKKHCQ